MIAANFHVPPALDTASHPSVRPISGSAGRADAAPDGCKRRGRAGNGREDRHAPAMGCGASSMVRDPRGSTHARVRHRPARLVHPTPPPLLVSSSHRPFSASDRRRIKSSTPPRSTAACTARAPVARPRALGRTRSPSRNCTISDRPSGAEGSPRFAARRTKFTGRITP